MTVPGTTSTRAAELTLNICKKGCDHGHFFKGGKLTNCTCRNLFREFSMWERAGIPELYWVKKPGDYPTAPVRVKKYLDRLDQALAQGVGMYVYGSFGAGKSGFAVEILKRALKRSMTGFFIFFPVLVEALTAFDEVPPEERDRLKTTILETDLVVLDDVGREYRREGSLWVPATFDSLFRQRLMSKKSTIMTSNFDFDRVEKMYGASVFSAFHGQLVEVEYVGEDYREKQQTSHTAFLDR